MIIEQIGIGPSIQDAYEQAKMLLAAPDEAELHFEILQEAKKKLFGLKTEPAKVRVWYEKEDPKPAPVKKETRAPKKEEPKREASIKAEKPRTEVKAQPQQPKKENKPAKPQPEKVEKSEKAEKPQKAEKPAQPKKESKPAKPQAEKPEETAAEAPAEPEETYVDLPVNEEDVAVKFLRLVTKGLGVENVGITLRKGETSGEYVYTLDCGDEDGALIGRRGETLDAIQYLLRLTENKGGEEKHRKLTVNVSNYREKRNASLRALAEKNARKVLKYGRNVALEPMSAYERRIIHTAVQGIEGVTSHSVGSDMNRKVIISLEEGVTPTNPGKGDYRDRGRNGRRDDRRGGPRGGRGFQKREPYQPAVTREPRKDAAGSLYGKIEIPKKDEE